MTFITNDARAIYGMVKRTYSFSMATHAQKFGTILPDMTYDIIWLESNIITKAHDSQGVTILLNSDTSMLECFYNPFSDILQILCVQNLVNILLWDSMLLEVLKRLNTTNCVPQDVQVHTCIIIIGGGVGEEYFHKKTIRGEYPSVSVQSGP